MTLLLLTRCALLCVGVGVGVGLGVGVDVGVRACNFTHMCAFSQQKKALCVRVISLARYHLKNKLCMRAKKKMCMRAIRLTVFPASITMAATFSHELQTNLITN